MILALVFLMFCIFVGGSVLAAAASNGYRVEHLSDQQQYLDERSAALLVADELDPAGSDIRFRVTIIDVTKTIQPVKMDDGGRFPDYGDPTTEHNITVMLPAGLKMTAMQRLAAEATVWQYLRAVGANADCVTLSNFVYHNGSSDVAITSMADFWISNISASDEIGGMVAISGSYDDSGDSFASFDAAFLSHDGEDMYDFTVDFGEFSQMNVTMAASYKQKTPVTVPGAATEYSASPTGYARITTVSTQTAITWADPKIEKGGA